jgi:uncharacterized protein YciI
MYLVTTNKRGCTEWDPTKPLVEQSRWAEHAAFMNGLVEDRFVVLGGTLDGDERAVLVVDADSEESVRATLAQDPWAGSHLRVESVEHWTIRLEATRA